MESTFFAFSDHGTRARRYANSRKNLQIYYNKKKKNWNIILKKSNILNIFATQIYHYFMPERKNFCEKC